MELSHHKMLIMEIFEIKMRLIRTEYIDRKLIKINILNNVYSTELKDYELDENINYMS